MIANVGEQIQEEVDPDGEDGEDKVAYYFNKWAIKQYERAIDYLEKQQPETEGSHMPRTNLSAQRNNGIPTVKGLTE